MPVYIVHAIDTEGPFTESLKATFKRLYYLTGLSLPASRRNLRRLQNGKVKITKKQKKVIDSGFSQEILNYHNSWLSLKNQIRSLTGKKTRHSLLDSNGNGWVYNWFCVDHVGFKKNPRKRKFGFHKIFDMYKKLLDGPDEIQFHHHPVNILQDASLCSTKIFGDGSTIFEILARRILERNWYPSVFRPGFHCERNDTNWFLEQFIPFDLSNQATSETSLHSDLKDNRFGDWSRAPKSWIPYHPHHDDYQKQGRCRRWIARILNLGTRLRLIKEHDIKNAFKEASKGTSVILGIATHDYRDMEKDLIQFKNSLKSTIKAFPKTKFYFMSARNAFRKALKIKKPKKPLNLIVKLKNNKLNIKSNQKIFGPVPFFALQLKNKKFFHENLDIIKPFYSWSYVFDVNSVPLRRLKQFGISAINSYGSIIIKKFNIVTKKWQTFLDL
jgi:hypothetical protein